MKHLRLLLPAIVLMLLSTSCEKDPELGTTTFTLAVNPMVGNEYLELAKDYVDQEGYRINTATFRFYAAHITLTSAQGDVEVAEYAFFDMEQVDPGKPMTFSVEVPAGDYTGISFWIGLDSVQNASDPALFENGHPLSLSPGTFWNWNTGYRFVMLEGYYDTVPNTPGPLGTSNFFNYHTGTNQLYAKAELGSASTAFSIAEGEAYTYSLDLDLNKVFYGPQDINRLNDAVTHTVGDVDLAVKFTQNFVRAFTLSNP